MIDCSINHCWHILNTTNKCFVPIHVQNRFGHGSKSKIITQNSFLNLSKIGKSIQCSEGKKYVSVKILVKILVFDITEPLEISNDINLLKTRLRCGICGFFFSLDLVRKPILKAYARHLSS